MKTSQIRTARKSFKRALLIVTSFFGLIVFSVILAEVLSPSQLIQSQTQRRSLSPTDPANPRWAAAGAGSKSDQHLNHFKESIRKTRGLILSTLESDSQGPISVGSAFRLRGVMEARQAIPTLHWAFQIPQGLKLISGKLEGTLSNVRSGDKHEVIIEVTRDVVQNQRVRFAAWKMEGSEAIGNGVSLKLQNALSLTETDDDTAPKSELEPQLKSGTKNPTSALGVQSVSNSSPSIQNSKVRNPSSSSRSREDFLKRALQ